MFQSMPGGFKSQSKLKGEKGGRPARPEKQDYLEDPKEYSRKASGKNRNLEIPVATRKSPTAKEEEVKNKRGRPCKSEIGPQSPNTRNEIAKKCVKRKRLSEKRRKAVS